MSKYKQASMRKSMRTESRVGKNSTSACLKRSSPFVKPSEQQNTAGQRRVRKQQALADVRSMVLD